MKTSKLKYNILIVCISALLMILVGSALGLLLFYPVTCLPIAQEKLEALSSNLPFAGVMLVVLLYTYFTEREIFSRYFSGQNGKRLSMLFLGVAAGAGMNMICVLIAVVSGSVSLAPGNLSFIWGCITFFSVWIQSSAEEMICRGYMLLHIEKKYGRVTAVLVTSLLFSLLHIFNDGVTLLSLANIILFGVFFAMSVERFHSLWFAIAAHTAWNYTQTFLFGLPNSGIASSLSAFRITAEKESLFYHAVFGIEGSVSATLILAAGTVLILLYSGKTSLLNGKYQQPGGESY